MIILTYNDSWRIFDSETEYSEWVAKSLTEVANMDDYELMDAFGTDHLEYVSNWILSGKEISITAAHTIITYLGKFGGELPL